MNYKETIEFLFKSLPQFQVIGSGAYKPGLGTAEAFDAVTGHPSEKLKFIHVAGTNGKGSTSTMIYSALRECGMSVGLFTSPHLKDFRERIVIDDKMISEDEVTSFVERYTQFINEVKPSFFEMTTAMALEHFARHNVDYAVIEVGLGGRLDSTNIIIPKVSVITNIAFDHMALLGDTLEKIAGEKAGIIKPNIPVIIGEYQKETEAVFRSKAYKESAPIIFAEDRYKYMSSSDSTFRIEDLMTKEVFTLNMNLTGEYQHRNVVTALAVADYFQDLPKDKLRLGISKASIRGRWQTLSRNPLIICDTGHNPAGITYVSSQLKKQKYNKLYFVLGIVNDKDFNGISELLPKDAYYIFSQASIPRAMPYMKLASLAAEHGLKGECVPTISQAISRAKELANSDDMIFIGGSTFTVAEIPDI